MTRNYFRIEVQINPDKERKIPYDKRVIDFPWHNSPTVFENYPLSHLRILIRGKARDIALIIRALIEGYGGNDAIETKI